MNASLLHKATKMREGFDISQERLELKAFYLASDNFFSEEQLDCANASENII